MTVLPTLSYAPRQNPSSSTRIYGNIPTSHIRYRVEPGDNTVLTSQRDTEHNTKLSDYIPPERREV